MAGHARRRFGIALITSTLVLIGGLFLWRLTWVTPAWWAPVDPDDAGATALADRVEFRIAEEAHRIRDGGEPWRLKITERQVNAWLATRLPAWFAHTQGVQWPQQLGAPQIRIRDGSVYVGLDVQTGGQPRVIVGVLSTTIVDGKLAVSIDRVTIGSLPVPSGSLRGMLAQLDGAAVLDDPNVAALVWVLLSARTCERP